MGAASPWALAFTAIFRSLWWRLKGAVRFFTLLTFTRGVTILTSLQRSQGAMVRARA